MELRSSITPPYSPSKKPRSWKGKLIVAGLLILAIAAAGSFAFLWTEERNTTTRLRTELAKSQQNNTANPKDNALNTLTKTDKNFVEYSNKEGKYSLRYPSDWVIAGSPELCNKGLLLLGADEKSVGKCATGNFGQMSISSAEGDLTEQAKLSKADYSNLATASTTVNGVKKIKQAGTASGQEGAGSYKDGTKVIKYLFFENGRTYSATYVQTGDYPDVQNEFEKMIEQSLKFSS